jgi:cob(I)alamin adenosyltransferase
VIFVLKPGYVHVYTGDGKGKTTAAIGAGIRALGANKKVCMIQFMKGQKTSEIETIDKLKNFDIFRFGSKNFVDKNNITEEDIKLAENGLNKAEQIINSTDYDLIILDEIIVAVDFKLLEEDKIINIIKNKPKKLEIIFTGRYASKKLIEIGDIVTEMKEIKHPFKEGMKPREGFEF